MPLFRQAVRQETATRAGLYHISPLAGVSLALLTAGLYISWTRLMKPMLLAGTISLFGSVVTATVLCSYTNFPSWLFILIFSGRHIGQGFLLQQPPSQPCP
jgi:hypothetical protein